MIIIACFYYTRTGLSFKALFAVFALFYRLFGLYFRFTKVTVVSSNIGNGITIRVKPTFLGSNH